MGDSVTYDWVNEILVMIGGEGYVNEAEFVRKLLKELNSHPTINAIRINTGPHGNAGTPDIIGCIYGHMFALEVKLAYNKPTELQLKRLAEWSEAGAFTEVITDDGTPAKQQAQAIIYDLLRWVGANDD